MLRTNKNSGEINNYSGEVYKNNGYNNQKE